MTKYRTWFISKIIEHIELNGNRDAVMRLTWPSPKQLTTVEIVEYAWECPPARCLELDDYKQEHGPDDDKWKQHMLQARDSRSLLFVSFDPSCVFARVTACLPIRQAGDKEVIGPAGVKLVELNEQRVWTKRKKYIQQAVLTTDHAGQDVLGQELAGDRFGVLAKSLEGRAWGFKVPAQDCFKKQ